MSIGEYLFLPLLAAAELNIHLPMKLR